MSAVEHAKVIRKLLKTHFPKHVKFSVRSSSFSGGDAIHIRPVNCCLEPEFHRRLYFLFSATAAGSFDGMTDYYDYHNRQFSGAKYVSVDRAYNVPVEIFDSDLIEKIKADPDYQNMLK